MRKIDTSQWGEFIIGDLFDIHPTKSYKSITNNTLFDGGDNIVVVNSAFNNGVGGTTTKEPTEKGNILTYSDTVDANTIFYQEKPFVGYAHVQGLYPIGKYANNWSKYSYLFFAVVFRKKALSLGFDFVNKFTRELAKKFVVKLPVDNKGDIDFDYMEEYMREKESLVSISLNNLLSIL